MFSTERVFLLSNMLSNRRQFNKRRTSQEAYLMHIIFAVISDCAATGLP